MVTTEKELLTVREAAKRLGVSPNTLRSWADSGDMPVIRLPSGHRRFHLHEIDRKRQEMGFPEREA
jgi:putative resolvase